MESDYFWPLMGLALIGSAVFDWCVGTARIGRFIEIDRDEPTFIIVTGLKCVAAVLILLVCFS